MSFEPRILRPDDEHLPEEGLDLDAELASLGELLSSQADRLAAQYPGAPPAAPRKPRTGLRWTQWQTAAALFLALLPCWAYWQFSGAPLRGDLAATRLADDGFVDTKDSPAIAFAVAATPLAVADSDFIHTSPSPPFEVARPAVTSVDVPAVDASQLFESLSDSEREGLLDLWENTPVVTTVVSI